MNIWANPTEELWEAVFAYEEIPFKFLQACEIFWPVIIQAEKAV